MIKQGIACDTSVDESGHCCNCLPGMVHDEETGECVEVSDCPCTGKLITVVDSKSKLKYIFAEKPVGELGKCERCVCINGELKCSSYCTIDSCQDGMYMDTDNEGCCFCASCKYIFY